MGDHRVERVGEQVPEGVDHPEQDAEAHRDHRRHDLIRAERRDDEPDGGESGRQQQEAQEAAVDRAPVGLAVDPDDDGVAERQPEHQDRKRQTREKLGEDDLDFPDGRRQEQLQGTGPSLLGEEPHRHDGHEEEE